MTSSAKPWNSVPAKNPASSTETSATSSIRRPRKNPLEPRRPEILAPLEKELGILEEKIAEQEAAQATLTTALSSEDVSGDAEKLRQTTNAVEKITHTLDLSYTRWSALTEEIETVKAKHGL